MSAEPIVVLARLTTILERLDIPYLIGGSFASSVFGTPRSTQDADVVAEITLQHVDPLVRDLSPDFFLDAAAMREAATGRSSFNILDQGTMFKIDIFVSPEDEWSRERLKRARSETVRAGGRDVQMRFSTPEDTVLHKLVWYRLGGEVSDRQWEDVLGLLEVQGTGLDTTYLARWAPFLKVEDLLARARKMAGKG
jgi:hypothetical protein